MARARRLGKPDIAGIVDPSTLELEGALTEAGAPVLKLHLRSRARTDLGAGEAIVLTGEMNPIKGRETANEIIRICNLLEDDETIEALRAAQQEEDTADGDNTT